MGSGMGKILKMPKLHLATSHDAMRPSMNAVFIEDNAGIATNGHILVKVSLENVLLPNILEMMNGMLLPSKMWAHFCSSKFPVFYAEEKKLFFKGAYGDILVRGINELFPHYKKAVGDWVDDSVKSIAICPKSLELINKIFDNPQAGLRLDFSLPNKAIRVVPNYTDHTPWECEALLMPKMLGDDPISSPFTFIKSGASDAGRNEGSHA